MGIPDLFGEDVALGRGKREVDVLDQMDWKYLFLDWEGRINRQPFWIGAIILFVAHALNGALFGYAIGGTLVSFGLSYCGVCVCIKRCP